LRAEAIPFYLHFDRRAAFTLDCNHRAAIDWRDCECLVCGIGERHKLRIRDEAPFFSLLGKGLSVSELCIRARRCRSESGFGNSPAQGRLYYALGSPVLTLSDTIAMDPDRSRNIQAWIDIGPMEPIRLQLLAYSHLFYLRLLSDRESHR